MESNSGLACDTDDEVALLSVPHRPPHRAPDSFTGIWELSKIEGDCVNYATSDLTPVPVEFCTQGKMTTIAAHERGNVSVRSIVDLFGDGKFQNDYTRWFQLDNTQHPYVKGASSSVQAEIQPLDASSLLQFPYQSSATADVLHHRSQLPDKVYESWIYTDGDHLYNFVELTPLVGHGQKLNMTLVSSPA